MSQRHHDTIDMLLDAQAYLLGLLEQVEWIQPRYNGNPSCPCCGAQQHWKHEPDCELAQVIGSGEVRSDDEEQTP